MHRGATKVRPGHGWDAVTEMLPGVAVRPVARGSPLRHAFNMVAGYWRSCKTPRAQCCNIEIDRKREAEWVGGNDTAHGDTFMAIELKPEHQRIVEDAVQSGHYRSVDEFVDEAFAAWRTRDNQPRFDTKKARAAADRIRELHKGLSLQGLKIKDLVNEGRR